MTNNIIRMSTLYAPTLREDPSDADIASAKLLVRAGMVRKDGVGPLLVPAAGHARAAQDRGHRPRGDGLPSAARRS